MKINNISNNTIENKRQNFNGIGGTAVDKMVDVSDKIAKAGFVATFIAQDGIGSIIPRIATGFTRNSDKTGKLNYRFAALEACRELLTGPPVMLLPIVTLGFAQKHIGATLKSPVSVIESFSNTLKGVFERNKTDISDATKLKQDFYKTSWENALKTTCGQDYKTNNNLVEQLSSLMKEMETAPAKAPKGTRTVKDIISQINTLVSDELKSHADVKGSFARLSYVDGVGKQASSPINAFANHLHNFSKDFFNKIGDLKTTTVEKAVDIIGETAKKRIGSRVITNFLTIGAVLLYSIVVPKLYKKLNKTNPGLIGLVDEPKAKCHMAAAKTKVNYEAFDKLKKPEKRPAFRGLGVGKIADSIKNDGSLRKFLNAFEFNGINMSFTSLMTFMGLGVLVPRVVNAYDKHDKREILTRDIFTIGALVFGSKALLKNISNSFEKKTGIVLSEKPEGYFEKSKPAQLMDRLRPFSGTQVFSNNDISLKYTNIDKFKGGLEGFCNFISKTGGNLSKFFANDEVTKKNMEEMLGKALKNSTDAEIIKAVTDKKNAKQIENIIKVFQNANNTFVKKSKSIIGVFDFISTFVVVPAFMIFLQKFNEKMTKSAIAKEKAQRRAFEQKFDAIKLTADLNQPDASKLNMT